MSFDTLEIAIVESAAEMVPAAVTGGVTSTPPVMLPAVVEGDAVMAAAAAVTFCWVLRMASLAQRCDSALRMIVFSHPLDGTNMVEVLVAPKSLTIL